MVFKSSSVGASMMAGKVASASAISSLASSGVVMVDEGVKR
jgi:hypothetical protein